MTQRSLLSMTLLIILVFGTAGAALTNTSESITIAIPVGEYSIDSRTDGNIATIENFGYLLIPGKPKLPSRIFPVALPPGAEVISVTYDVGEVIELSGTYDIPPSPLPRAIGQEDPEVYQRDKLQYDTNYESVYGSSDVYPVQAVELVQTGMYRKYNLVDIRVTPFAYYPQTRQLVYHSDIVVTISYVINDKRADADIGDDNLAYSEKTAAEMILNYDQASQWYSSDGLKRGLFSFVIITLDALTTAVTPLVDWEIVRGRTVQVVTTSWINTNYTGYDEAQRIRNFLRDKYPADQWGIENVLIVGDYDDIPMRQTVQDWGYGPVKTDLYYAELSYPDSLSWDSNDNYQWGDDDDEIDFYSEVNVGRIPWSGTTDVEKICLKTVAYDQNADPSFKKNMLLLAGYFWNDDPNPVTDCAVLMEQKVDHPWFADWTFTRMYEKNSTCWSDYDCDYPLLSSNVMAVWPNEPFAFVNWAGHGSPTSSHIYGIGAPAFISSYNCPSLNDNYPAIIFADACSNSDPQYVNIGKAMIKDGAVGFLGATEVAGGMPGWSGPLDGSSQSLDYFFTKYITSGDYTFGEAHQKALREMYLYSLWGGAVKYQMFQWGNIWGSPGIMINRLTIEIRAESDLPEYINHTEPTIITVRITEGADTYLSESGTMYCSFDGGDWEPVALTPVGGDLFEAEITPQGCDITLNYYFGAEGSLSGAITCPFNAPAEVFSTHVGIPTIVMEDDFELDQDWTVSNSPGLTDGAWSRGVPAGGGEYGDPASDYDLSGQCYLTGNEYGNSDIDGGATYLTSPLLQLLYIDAEIHYALWYTNNFAENPNSDYFIIHLSDDDGASWTPVDSIGPHSLAGWSKMSFRISDYIIPNNRVRVRFEANDLGDASVVEAAIDAVSVTYIECVTVIYGDVNNDGDVNVADAVYIINYVFNGGPAPSIPEAADANCDENVDVADGVYLINYVFKGGPPPGCL